MRLPKKLKDFNVYINGVDYLTEIKEVTTPKIVRKMEDYQGAGLDSPIKVDLGGEAMEAEFTFGGYMEDIVSLIGGSLSGTQIRMEKALQREDSEDFDNVRITLRGRFIEEDIGSDKKGDDTEHKFKFSPTYYKAELNNKAFIEIDVLLQKFIMGGVDRMAGLRKAIGH